jgi:threonine dehydrogenase-like Zn-dependent dehydrogenase
VRETPSGVVSCNREILADDDTVRVRITSAGICGSDLERLAHGSVTEVVPGHEFGGFLDDGTLVAVQPNRPCGACLLCRSGADHLCRVNPQFYGVTHHGGMAEQAFVHPSCLVPVPPEVDAQVVGLVEPVAVALHAVNRAGLRNSERVLVVGSGSIGLLCAAVLRDRGQDVAVVARHAAQREAAEALGATLGADGTYPVVIDATGSTSGSRLALEHSDPRGRIVLVAVPWEPLGYDASLLVKEVTVLPAIFYGHHEGEREFSAAAGLLARNRAIAEILVTHRFGLHDAARAFDAAGDRAGGAIKVHLLP